MDHSKRNNFVKSPTTNGTTLDFLNTTPLNQPRRAMTRPKHPNIDNIDQDSLDDTDDYNMLLPAVKVQKKKKKASPTSGSNRGGDSYMEIPTGNRNHHPSTSRMSTSGMKRADPKLRPTLD